MNYRHQFHAGNFADVLKHIVLVQVIAALQRKEKGFLYLDTHAGRGRYDLVQEAQGLTLARRPEWPEGLGRVLAESSAPEAVRSYTELVREFDRSLGNLAPELRFYPGSPWIAARLARPQDRLALVEKQPQECDALRTMFFRAPRVSVQCMDGYTAVKAVLPPPEKRACVLIDPPFESQTEWKDVAQALRVGLERMPAATFLVWYPLTERARVDAFVTDVGENMTAPAWAAELAIAGEGSGIRMRGCGILAVNPPWQSDQAIALLLPWLSERLAQAPGGEGRLTWVVPER